LRVRIPQETLMSVSCGVLCVVRYKSLRRVNHSSRGFQQIVVSLNICYRWKS